MYFASNTMKKASLLESGPVLLPFPDRKSAGRVLARLLESRIDPDNCIVLALPRGGVPVAVEIATILQVPMDLLLVRKIGMPGHEELALGAIASNDVTVWNERFRRRFGTNRPDIFRAVQKARDELHRRNQLYRGDKPPPEVTDRSVILVDDGLATGATMRAAIKAVRAQRPARIIVAVPIASPDTVELLLESADTVICLATPEPFNSVGEWYVDFSQLTDTDVCRILNNGA